MGIYSRWKLRMMLEKLKRRKAFPENQWVNLVGEAIRIACTSESRFYQAVSDLINKESGEKVTKENEKKYIELLSAAQNMLKIAPREHPDTELEQEIRTIFSDHYFSSWPFKVNVLLLAVFLLSLVGGTVFFGSEIRGFIDQKDDSLRNLQSAENLALVEISSIAKDARQEALNELRKEIATEEIAAQKQAALKAINKALRGDDEQGGALSEIKNKKDGALADIDIALNGKDGQGGALAAIRNATGEKVLSNTALGKIEAEKKNAILRINQALGEPEKVGALAEIDKIKTEAIEDLLKKKKRIVESWEALTPKNVDLSLSITIWYLVLVSGFALASLGFSIAAFLSKKTR
jgi:hypothetical protein